MQHFRLEGEPYPVSRWLFRDRADAGQQLAARLTRYRDEDPIVLALPRGGVPVGYEIARVLGAPLDVFPVRKLGAPGQRELGIGAIAPGGACVLDSATIRELGITRAQIENVVAAETLELQRQLHRFRGERPMPALQGRTVILVDDGLATGVSARVAILAIRALRPRRVVLAVPVCAPKTAEGLSHEVDELVCLARPENFLAVGRWYHDFQQTSDETVLELLGYQDPTASFSAEGRKGNA